MAEKLKGIKGDHLGTFHGYGAFEDSVDVLVSDFDFVSIFGAGVTVSPLIPPVEDEESRALDLKFPAAEGDITQLNATGLYGLHIEANGEFHVFAGVTGTDY